MIKYKVIKALFEPLDTEKMLNEHAQKGWKITCSYCRGMWFVLEKEVEEMDISKKDFVEFEEFADEYETKTEPKAKRNKAHPYSKSSRMKHLKR